MGVGKRFAKDQWWEARNPLATSNGLSFQDNTVLVTGANSALGASPFILAVRSTEKGEAAKAAIQRETGCSGEIILMTVDLSTFASVKEFARRLDQRVSKLDVPSSSLCCVLSNTLLVLLILPKLRASTTESDHNALPHLCFLNSLASHRSSINDPFKFDITAQYYLVKLAAFFAIQGIIEQLKERGEADGIIINACCPGLCKTKMPRDFPLAGSHTLVSATGLGPESSGKLWRNDKYTEPGEVLDSERGRELYRETWHEILSILQKHL
ncbi:uncharacterized protein F4817DRAFT_361430 [Daldinia loculata]|uniref:uncharacterized protein n=1 Tax=Daldinia loculata TaxID=103429 RepID=UPI0020C3EE30|nr:uncharacterized protein F4817DRAFT_361430 [Daldinia loculata]KAI1643586.1 hypothetical protein F4817DRAFT_361430 [Daldinia loculata]